MMITPLSDIIGLQRVKSLSIKNIKVTHQLKTWPDYFESMYEGTKKFDLRRRKEGRVFRQYQYVIFREWDPETEEYTGRWILSQVNYVLYSDECVQFGFEGGLGGDILNLITISNSN